MKSCLVGDIIMVYVGPKAKRYIVHEALLTRYEWFRKQILGPSDLASQGSITLHEEDPKVFELLISWLYRKKLKAISNTDEKLFNKEAELYVDLYLRASTWEIVELQNAVMDGLSAWQAGSSLCTAELIEKVFVNTGPQSPLRSYIVDNYIYQMKQLHEDKSPSDPIDATGALMLKPSLNIPLEFEFQAFVLHCCDTLFQLCTKSKIHDPDKKTGCHYHKHNEGEACGL